MRRTGRTRGDTLPILIVTAATIAICTAGFIPAVCTVFALYTITCFAAPKTR